MALHGAAVTVLDPAPFHLPYVSVEASSSPEIEMVRGSVLDGPLVHSLVAKAEIVYHLASVVGPLAVMTNPIAALEASLFGTANVARSASYYRRKVVFTSSSEIYGVNASIPEHEVLSLSLQHQLNGRSSYAAGKIAAEAILLAQYRCSPFQIVVTRLFNVAGSAWRGAERLVIPQMVGKALRHEPIIVHGDGHQTRTFVHVSDAVDALEKLSQCQADPPIIVNIGADHEVSMLDLAMMIKRRTKSSSEIRLVDYNEVYGSGYLDQLRRVPDVGRLKSLIDWVPRKGLGDIIDDVIRDYQFRIYAGEAADDG